MFFFFNYFIQESGVFQPQLTIWQLIQPDLESRFVIRSQFGPSIQSGSSPSAGLQVVTQSTHLLKDCYPQLVSNPHRSEIRLPEQLDYWWILWLSSSNYGDESHTILGANIWKSSRDKVKKETSQSIEKTVSSILQMLLFYPTNLIYVPDFYLYSCNFYFEILNC